MSDDKPAPRRAVRFASFSLRDLIFLVTIIAVCVAWWIDRSRPVAKSYDIVGPVSVWYEVTVSSNSRVKRNVREASGIDFVGDNIVVFTENGGVVIAPDNLLEFHWTRNR